MTAPLKTDPSPARLTLRQRRLYIVWALVFIILGGLFLALNLGFSGPLLNRAPAWPALLILAGFFFFIADRAARNFIVPAYAIPRGDYTTAELRVVTFAADARVSVFAGSTQLAVGQFPNARGPQLQGAGNHARVTLHHFAAPPFIAGDWGADLVKNLPWAFDLRTTFGHYTLNLRDLTLNYFKLRSLAGNVDLTLPATGQGDLDLNLTCGDCILRVPEGMAVKLRVAPGSLATVRLDETAFIKTDKHEWVTPYFSAASQRYTLNLTLGLGDLTVM